MTMKTEDPDVCEACGVAGEMGYVIGEGDIVAEVSISADSRQALDAEFAKYVELAKSVSADVKYETSELNESSTSLHATFHFEVSAEKLIFELKSRSLMR